MPIILNHEVLRQKTLNGIEKYIKGDIIISDRDGLVHLSTGKYRAENLKRFLTQPLSKGQIVIVLLALFGNKHSSYFEKLGRSNRLAGFVADQFIQGTYQTANIDAGINTLESDVFSKDVLNNSMLSSKNMRNVVNEMWSYSYTDNTKLVRDLLTRVVEKEIPLTDQKAFWTSVEKVKIKLDSSDMKSEITKDFPENIKIDELTIQTPAARTLTAPAAAAKK